MTNVYDQHNSTFAKVSAYVILAEDRTRAATIAFKMPADGAGRLWCYLHILGMPMVRGFAGGYGYDKKSAAASAAAHKLPAARKAQAADGGMRPDIDTACAAIFEALRNDGGYDWSRELENRGLTVLQAV